MRAAAAWPLLNGAVEMYVLFPGGQRIAWVIDSYFRVRRCAEVDLLRGFAREKKGSIKGR
jgi:hypothetical protein